MVRTAKARVKGLPLKSEASRFKAFTANNVSKGLIAFK
jgi:hypothetical protein